MSNLLALGICLLSLTFKYQLCKSLPYWYYIGERDREAKIVNLLWLLAKTEKAKIVLIRFSGGMNVQIPPDQLTCI